MKNSNKYSVAAGIGIFVLAALFSVALLSAAVDFGGMSPASSSLFYKFGKIFTGAYGFCSLCIPVFLIVAGLQCFNSKWSAKNGVVLAGSAVPFFTLDAVEHIIRMLAFSESGSVLAVKIGAVVLIGAMLIAAEFILLAILGEVVAASLKKHRNEEAVFSGSDEDADFGENDEESVFGDDSDEFFDEASENHQLLKAQENEEAQNISRTAEENAENVDESALEEIGENSEDSSAALFDLKTDKIFNEQKKLLKDLITDGKSEEEKEKFEKELSDSENSLEILGAETENFDGTAEFSEKKALVSSSETAESGKEFSFELPEPENQKFDDEMPENTKNEEKSGEILETEKTLEEESEDIPFVVEHEPAIGEETFVDEPLPVSGDDFDEPPVSEIEIVENDFTEDSAVPLSESDFAVPELETGNEAENAEITAESELMDTETEPEANTADYKEINDIFTEMDEDAAENPVIKNQKNNAPGYENLPDDFFDDEDDEDRSLNSVAGIDDDLADENSDDSEINDPDEKTENKNTAQNLENDEFEIPDFTEESLAAEYGEQEFSDDEDENAENFSGNEIPFDSDSYGISENGDFDDGTVSDEFETGQNLSEPVKSEVDEDAGDEFEIEEDDDDSIEAQAVSENAEPPENEELSEVIQNENLPEKKFGSLLKKADSLVAASKISEEDKKAGITADDDPYERAKKRRIANYNISSELLNKYENGQYWIIDDETKRSGEYLTKTLKEFGIDAQVTGIRKGPVVTMFELLPAPGVKLSRIVSLQDNIALSLAASSVRIVAPIPGKHAVGIEVPNKKRAVVSFREIIEMDLPEFKKMQIPVILGKDISGEPHVIDLTKTPHLLIAGSTGSGKSVCVNSMILSVLYKRSPEQVKLVLIDPKVVELKLYNDIPHLLTPVITEPKRALQALQYCLCEMERRYACLDGMGVRDIVSYNKKIVERHIATEKLPYIVVIIDEFADLMATTGKELESAVARLAAMSRAVGIHLVLATQRPSVNVITGLIKANIPSRIAFMVASRQDSQIIIDGIGAEKLLGKGDMLYSSATDPFPTRIQGTLVGDDEVERVVNDVKQYGEPDYIDDEIFVDDDEEESSGPGLFSDGEDPLYDQALQIVVQAGKASASYIQRRLKIGYNRAARLVEEMEERGIVGPQNGSKPREVIHIP